MKLSRLMFLLALMIPALASATQISYTCGFLGEFDTASSINSSWQATLNECSVAVSQDKGPLWSNGTTWVPFNSLSPFATGTPNTRTVALSTAFQATDPTHPSLVTVNLTSTAALSLSGGTTNSASIVIGSTSGVASGTGTTIGLYSNSNTGALTIGLNLSTISAVPYSFTLPAGWFFAVRQTAGTVAITSAFDQSLG